MKAEWIDWIDARGGVVDLTQTAELPPGLAEAWTPAGLELVPVANSSVRIVEDGEFELYLKGSLVAPWPDWQGLIERSLSSGGTGVARHINYFLPESFYRRRNGSTMIRRSALLYRELGLEQIQTKAFAVGKYVWARAGFDFASEVVAADVNRVVSAFAVELGLTTEPLEFFEHPWLFAALDRDPDSNLPLEVAPRAISEAIAARSFNVQRGPAPTAIVGPIRPSKALLIYADYNDWEGILDLQDESPGFKRLLSYTEGV